MSAETATQVTDPNSTNLNIVTYQPAGSKGRVIARGISTLAFSAAMIWAFAIAGYFDITGIILLGVAGLLLSVGLAKSTAQFLEANTLHLDEDNHTYRFGPEGEWKNVRGLTWKSSNLTPPRILSSHAYMTRFTLLLEDDENVIVLQDAHDTLGKKSWSKKHRDGLRWLAENTHSRTVAEKQTIEGFVEAMDIVAGEYRDREEETEDNG